MRRPALLYYRYFLFGLVIVTNAIICSTAVWNLTLAVDSGATTQIDSYMAFLGAFSLLLAFPLIFLDLFVRHAITARVWAECLWVGSLLVLHLPGAIAVSAILPQDMCTSSGPQAAVSSSCTSTTLLQAFAWICTTNLLLYLVLLITATILHGMRDDTVWHASVREYPRFSSLPCQIKSRPASPTTPHFNTDTFVAAPQPRRPPVVPVPIQSTLEERYQIEHLSDVASFQPPTTAQVPGAYVPYRVAQGRRQASSTMPSLYPLQIQAALGAQKEPTPLPSPQGHTSTPASAMPLPPTTGSSAAQPLVRPSPIEPDKRPLGDWPRRDIMQNPVPPRVQRKQPPLRVSSFATQELASVDASANARPGAGRHESDPALSRSSNAPSAFPSVLGGGAQGATARPRPTGPRHRTQSSTDTTRTRPSLEMTSGDGRGT